jgi:hypothetical protein
MPCLRRSVRPDQAEPSATPVGDAIALLLAWRTIGLSLRQEAHTRATRAISRSARSVQA